MTVSNLKEKSVEDKKKYCEKNYTIKVVIKKNVITKICCCDTFE